MRGYGFLPWVGNSRNDGLWITGLWHSTTRCGTIPFISSPSGCHLVAEKPGPAEFCSVSMVHSGCLEAATQSLHFSALPRHQGWLSSFCHGDVGRSDGSRFPDRPVNISQVILHPLFLGWRAGFWHAGWPWETCIEKGRASVGLSHIKTPEESCFPHVSIKLSCRDFSC